ncbi:hypothetical protein BDY21DRAFT_124127 [Lineolata rhizophorae]|uniref:Uncharacterized protein n=1 Tax=Lineolata rhizophorae TaxID=578093 RepID=A0A6A6NPS3_9PEZI|nr:hypothetical protein BDY21DRAFT_124127 [Lineolata rhizophorae]
MCDAVELPRPASSRVRQSARLMRRAPNCSGVNLEPCRSPPQRRTLHGRSRAPDGDESRPIAAPLRQRLLIITNPATGCSSPHAMLPRRATSQYRRAVAQHPNPHLCLCAESRARQLLFARKPVARSTARPRTPARVENTRPQSRIREWWPQVALLAGLSSRSWRGRIPASSAQG